MLCWAQIILCSNRCHARSWHVFIFSFTLVVDGMSSNYLKFNIDGVSIDLREETKCCVTMKMIMHDNGIVARLGRKLAILRTYHAARKRHDKGVKSVRKILSFFLKCYFQKSFSPKRYQLFLRIHIPIVFM